MNCLIITGMSGAGKSLAVDALEDIGFYCVDNMPSQLIPKFVELFKGNAAKFSKVAFVVDIRADIDYVHLADVKKELAQDRVSVKVLFLDCTSDVLISRHKENRRRHPLAVKGIGTQDALAEERRILAPIKDNADFIIDTTNLSTAGFKTQLEQMFGTESEKMIVSFISFGFKYGMPRDADMIFDVRCLKNPYYIPELKHRTGLEPDVAEYVFSDAEADHLISLYLEMLDIILPRFISEGRNSLSVGIGCTGGKHRSVAMSEKLKSALTAKGFTAVARHRDIEKH